MRRKIHRFAGTFEVVGAGARFFKSQCSCGLTTPIHALARPAEEEIERHIAAKRPKPKTKAKKLRPCTCAGNCCADYCYCAKKCRCKGGKFTLCKVETP